MSSFTEETLASKQGQCYQSFGLAHKAMGLSMIGENESINQAEAAKHIWNAAKYRFECAPLADHESVSKFCATVGPATMLSSYEGLSPFEEWNLASLHCTEESIIESIPPALPVTP